MATDVVGYSHLMELDEVGTLKRLKTLRRELFEPTVKGHGGRIVKLMGDGALVEFQSAVDAVICAVAFQEKVSAHSADTDSGDGIQFRIGVNIGDVILNGQDIYGDAVNIAARLEGIARPGTVLVSYNVYEQTRKTTKLHFTDLGKQHLKNIGGPVQVFQVENDVDGAGRRPDSPTVLNRPAIVVLPFVNLGGDSHQEYFADGLTEDLITALSHWRLFPVISRMSAFTYKGKRVKAQDVAEDLGVSYVLEGSVRKSGDRVRIATKLIDARTGYDIWAHNFDRDITDIFSLQDQITRLIAMTMQPELARAEGQQSLTKAPKDLRAWDYVQRGLFAYWKYTVEANKTAEELFEAAIRIDPDYSQGYTGLTLAYHMDIIYGVPGARESAPGKMLATAKRAVDLDDEDAMAHLALAFALHRTNQYDQAILEARKAVNLNPSDPMAHIELGSTLDFTGSCEAGIAAFNVALSLVPPHSMRHLFQCRVALGYLHAGEFESAISWARSALSAGPAHPSAYVTLAASLAHMGRIAEAKNAFAAGEAVQAGFIEKWHEWPLYSLEDQKQLVIDGLCQAGWKGDPSQLPSPWKAQTAG